MKKKTKKKQKEESVDLLIEVEALVQGAQLTESRLERVERQLESLWGALHTLQQRVALAAPAQRTYYWTIDKAGRSVPQTVECP